MNLQNCAKIINAFMDDFGEVSGLGMDCTLVRDDEIIPYYSLVHSMWILGYINLDERAQLHSAINQKFHEHDGSMFASLIGN